MGEPIPVSNYGTPYSNYSFRRWRNDQQLEDDLSLQRHFDANYGTTPYPNNSVGWPPVDQQLEHDLSHETSIRKMLDEQPPIATAEWSIYRIPKRLSDMKSNAYKPTVFSIGPFYHGRFMATQQFKLQCLRSYLIRVQQSVDDVMDYARDWERKARRCYAEPIEMSSHDFVKMMLMDGCFIVELIILANHEHFEIQDHRIDLSFFNVIRFDVYQELTMLENQLPFFVLQALFNLLPPHKMKDDISFVELAGNFLSKGLIRDYNLPDDISKEEVKHLVDLLSFYYVPSLDTEEHTQNSEIESRKFLLPPTITQLCDAGVKVKKAREGTRLMDISFKNGVLEIPPFEIHDDFEIYVRNLMAFEQYCVQGSAKERYVSHYIEFLDGLISTKKDVALLVNEEIIINHIGGSDKEVSELFNNLCKYTHIPDNFYYYGTSKNLRDHCKKWWPRSKATLRRDYFNSSWASISVCAATFAIILTLLQTIFTAISTFK